MENVFYANLVNLLLTPVSQILKSKFYYHNYYY